MLMSIITVTFNCEEDIKRTMDSIVIQNYKNYEVLIIDGNSTDRTLKYIAEYKNIISNMKVFSEPDNGIYDAMNKGIIKARGDYLYFLNAGDCLENASVLKKVASKMVSNKDIYYGNICKEKNIEKYPPNLKLFWLINREKMICHQAIFAKRKIYVHYLYNTEYEICADREWLIRVLKNGVTYEYMEDIVVCNYDINGISSDYSRFEKDSLKIARKYGTIGSIIFIRLKRFIGKKIKSFV